MYQNFEDKATLLFERRMESVYNNIEIIADAISSLYALVDEIEPIELRKECEILLDIIHNNIQSI